MKKFYVLSLIFGLVLGQAEFAWAQTNSLPDVYISEVNWAGSSYSNADEWIEIANRTSETVDLSGWLLDGAASGGGAIQLAEETFLSAGDVLLVSNYNIGNEKTTLAVEPQLVTASVSLLNSKLTLRLIKPDGTVVDSIAFGSSPSAGSTSPYASAIRTKDGDVVTAGTSIGLLDPAQFGTPGMMDIGWFSIAPIDDADAEDIEDSVNEEVIPDTETSDTEEPATEVPSTEVTDAETSHDPDCCGCSCVAEDTNTSAPDNTEEDIEAPNATDANDASAEEPANEEDPTTEENAAVGDDSVDEVQEDTMTTEEEVLSEDTTENESPDYTLQQFIRLSEFVSDPAEGPEWIELHNPSSMTIALDGMHVKDASGGTTVLEGDMEPGGYFVILSPKGKLNNDTDIILLYAASGELIDRIEYGSKVELRAPKKGESGGLIEGAWYALTTMTPGEANIPNPVVASASDEADEEVVAETSTETNDDEAVNADTSTETTTNTTGNSAVSATSNSSAGNAAQDVVTVVSLATKPGSTSKTTTTKSTTSTAKKKANPEVTVTGTITVAPGVLGKQIAYIEGYQLYLNKSDWPTLQVGDAIRATGIPSDLNGEIRLKLANSGVITVLNPGEVTTHALNETAFTNAAIGMRMTFNGDITNREKKSLTMQDGDRTFSIHLPKDVNGLLIAQDTLAGSGILRSDKDGFYVQILAKDDLLMDTTVSAYATDIASTIRPENGSSKSVAGAGLVTGTLGMLGFWLRKSLIIS